MQREHENRDAEMTDTVKQSCRKLAMQRRSEVDSDLVSRQASMRLLDIVNGGYVGRTIAGYVPIRSEISPVRAMEECHDLGCRLCVPVVVGPERPLEFRQWTPGVEMVFGAFGTRIPATRVVLVPELLIVPLLAFDNAGWRLGYGGGFYDRTLAGLRKDMKICAVGFASSHQEFEILPHDGYDQQLDAVVTETSSRWFRHQPETAGT